MKYIKKIKEVGASGDETRSMQKKQIRAVSAVHLASEPMTSVWTKVHHLCDFVQVTQPLWVYISTSAQRSFLMPTHTYGETYLNQCNWNILGELWVTIKCRTLLLLLLLFILLPWHEHVLHLELEKSKTGTNCYMESMCYLNEGTDGTV